MIELCAYTVLVRVVSPLSSLGREDMPSHAVRDLVACWCQIGSPLGNQKQFLQVSKSESMSAMLTPTTTLIPSRISFSYSTWHRHRRAGAEARSRLTNECVKLRPSIPKLFLRPQHRHTKSSASFNQPTLHPKPIHSSIRPLIHSLKKMSPGLSG